MRRKHPPARKSLRTEKLSKKNRQVIQYWHEAILEGERENTNSKNISELQVRISAADFERGRCSPTTHRTLVGRQTRNERRQEGPPPENEHSDKPLPVVICPLAFHLKGNRDSGAVHLEVLWMPGLLHPNGTLAPPSVKQPWISRELLEPSGGSESPVLGTVRRVNKFSSKYRRTSWDGWRDYVAYANTFLEAVTGSNIQNTRIPGYERKTDMFLLFDRSASGSTAPLVQILKDVLDGNINAGTLKRFATPEDPKPSPYRDNKWNYANGSKLHLGHFNDRYPLSHSQRKAVHRFLETKEGNFLSVTGPPGTGKTTVIQSIIASLWVRAAVLGKESPPVIVCVGATNQAVINIIDSFEKSGSEDPISGHWLPRITSYGRFCSSETKASDVRHYQLELRKGGGLSSLMDTEEYHQTAVGAFQEKFIGCFGKKLHLEKAAKFLQQLLAAEYKLLVAEVNNLSQLGFWSFIKSLISATSSVSPEQFAQGIAALDVSRRHRMFLLATHYWEARWLLSALPQKKQSNSRKDNRWIDSRRSAWEQRAMITPAFVSTLSMLPRFFPFNRHNPVPPIDVLICDEAGQIPIETGAATLPIADRALIVGDCLQLEPVWAVQPHTDRALLESNHLADLSNESDWERHQERGFLVSNGCLMKLSLHSTEEIDQGERGCFLSEQRRSVPEIVEFSNAIAYDNKLIARRKPIEHRILPAFGFVDVKGTAEQRGSSRVNREEAQTIVDWLVENERKLKEFYRSNDLCDLVAVITPFAAQHRELLRILPNRFRRMIVGTVGGLQGAERPVVIFSSVYDEEFKGTFFFDLNVNLLNVAVSRARDSFIVIGNKNIFKKKMSPSGYLAHFLFASPENELPPPTQSESAILAQFPPEAAPMMLKTLDDHVNELKDAFHRAKREVMIVSATVSSAALRRDRLPELIQRAVQRGVRVRIYADYDLNREGDGFKSRSEEAFELLRDAGAEFQLVARTHLKFLAVDGHTLANGSFNWLSANRNEASRHSKQEWSTKIQGKWASEQIKSLEVDIEYLAIALEDLKRLDEDGEF